MSSTSLDINESPQVGEGSKKRTWKIVKAMSVLVSKKIYNACGEDYCNVMGFH